MDAASVLLITAIAIPAIIIFVYLSSRSRQRAIERQLQEQRLGTIREFQEQLVLVKRGAEQARQDAKKAKESYDAKYRSNRPNGGDGNNDGSGR